MAGTDGSDGDLGGGLRSSRGRDALLLLIVAIAAFLVMGYHPGMEDDGVYLAAVKSDVMPGLYQQDADFFRVQLQATFFDKWMAWFIRLTHVPVAWAECLWQLITIGVIVWACWSIACCLFRETRARWAAVAMVAAMFTLPVAGTELYLVDQHLHPRNLATALILVAIARMLGGRRWQALPLLVIATLLHPIMGVLGISFCFFLWMTLLERVPARLRMHRDVAAGLMPLGWIFEPPSDTWREALRTRNYYFLNQWAWYEWLGAIAPLVLFGILWRWAAGRGDRPMARFALAVFAFGVFQQIVALIVLTPDAFIRLAPFQPMRYLHLVYFFLCLIGGGLLGKYVLGSRVWRWSLLLLVANGGMLIAQRELFAGSPHLEMPWMPASTSWLQAFEWIRVHTPRVAYFSVDPYYMAAPGEDYHSFRALAERSMLTDALKDSAVVTQVPSLGPEWHRQQVAQAGWAHFELGDFERLKREYGVDWVLTRYPAQAGLKCEWHNEAFSVCRIP